MTSYEAKSLSSQDNFLKTGDNNIIECINLAGHVTNFVDNEASIDFLQSSKGQNDHGPLCSNVGNNFSALMRDLENESGIPVLCKDSY